MGVIRSRPRLDRRGFRLFLLASVIVLLVVPALTNRDDFPLSTYPMYATARGSDVSFVTAWGRDMDGERRELSLGIIGSSDDPLIVAGELRASIRIGEAGARCREIARRASSDPSLVSIEVTAERHDVVEYTLGGPSLIERIVHAECALVDADK